MDQVAIAITGFIAIWITQQDREHLKKWACIFGIVGQPFWFYSSYQAEQWGVFVLCFFYLYAWLVGFNKYWIKREGAE